MAFLKKYWIAILIFISAAGVSYLLYFFFKNKYGKVELPNNGQGIPFGWSPTQSVIEIEDTFGNWFTDDDEPRLFSILSDKTKDQLAAIYNEYYRMYGEKITDQFKDHLSGDDLTRALSFFNGII